MKQFPSLDTLASSHEDAVIKCWEGLGYYNRARNILKAARYFMEHHGGQIPACKESLLKAPGLGPYTVGAILSFAFGMRAEAVDGNVLRVMSRFFFIEKSISSTTVQKEIATLTYQFLPEKDPHVVMEALIELGATLCGKIPRCVSCPIKEGCLAHRAGAADLLPIKASFKKNIHLFKDVLVLSSGDKVLMKKIQGTQVLAGLYEFPSFEKGDALEVFIKDLFAGSAQWRCDLAEEQYSYTHHIVELFPSLWETSCEKRIEGCEWVDIDHLTKLPFSAGHRRILLTCLKEHILHEHTSY
jgi:A/G-specific adenine glycosylase